MAEDGIRILAPGEERAVWVFEELMEFKVTGAETNGSFSLWVDTPLPGYGPPLHVHHREDEAFLVLEGDIVFSDGERRIEAKPGTWVWVPRGTPHAFKNVGSSSAKMVVVATPAGVEGFFLEAGQPAEDRTTPPPPDPERIVEVAARYGTEVVGDPL